MYIDPFPQGFHSFQRQKQSGNASADHSRNKRLQRNSPPPDKDGNGAAPCEPGTHTGDSLRKKLLLAGSEEEATVAASGSPVEAGEDTLYPAGQRIMGTDPYPR